MATVLASSKRGHATFAAAERAMERAFRNDHGADYAETWQDETTGRYHWHITAEDAHCDNRREGCNREAQAS